MVLRLNIGCSMELAYIGKSMVMRYIDGLISFL